jgi:hypothetical protein
VEERRAFDGAAEAHLVALACTTPPAGCEWWILRLLAEVEVRALQRRGLDRRRDDQVTMARAASASVTASNHDAASIGWRCTTAATRLELTRLSPRIQE